ncbi:MAG: DNA polymerase III subunit epsilon, partial [Pseudomonadales bacterium]|nr:DNA polymerase III subunit epsilon [Pseudomonadales bacterium]
CVELQNRRHTRSHYHQYINPEREVEAGALEVHGISNEFLADKPRFAQIVDEFIEFVAGAELVIHNAPFDVGFIDHELHLMGHKVKSINDICSVVDSLVLARQKHPGQRNSLDALCKRYAVDNSGRELHGALLDSEILADVYLLMTGGQTDLQLSSAQQAGQQQDGGAVARHRTRKRKTALPVIGPSTEEQQAHQQLLARIAQSSAGRCIWQQLDTTPQSLHQSLPEDSAS